MVLVQVLLGVDGVPEPGEVQKLAMFEAASEDGGGCWREWPQRSNPALMFVHSVPRL